MKTIKIYTIEELKQINVEAYNKVIEREIPKLLQFQQEVLWNDYNNILPRINRILEIHGLKIEWVTNYYTDCARIVPIDYQEDVYGSRAYGKLQKIIEDLKCINFGWCDLELINNLEDKGLKYCFKYGLWEVLADGLNSVVSVIEDVKVSEEDIVDDLLANEWYFTGYGEPIYN